MISHLHCDSFQPSVLRRCWLGGRKGIRPVKTEWWGAGVVICMERGADLVSGSLMPLPLTVSCFSEIQYLSGTSSPGESWINGCVCVIYLQTEHSGFCSVQVLGTVCLNV